MTDYTKAPYAKTEKPENPKLITIPCRARKPLIELEYPEFQCLCPVSERHDQGIVKIKYKPTKKILESKSIRDYLAAWRNKRTWQEYATEEVADQLYKACKPEWLVVEIAWAARGGILAKTISERGTVPK
ncbi:MAG: NADPH-dependent 7-cyano-7-deazaguanine reductase QueF [Candidatus Thermoplasmatota archaeon]|nr:NADPH-dependent 7-cyano-7-deazaguanine reductase QueF [Candidatus Thermoplasmatota archaeon]